ncbi:MAG: GAF domain-containing protein [PVC group bacterium]|nr:GAF domain-containing protein [PVC group bacterium]
MKFEEIIEVKHWQNIQNTLSSIVNISLRTVNDSGEIIVRPSNSAALCMDVLTDYPEAIEECWQWFPQLAQQMKSCQESKYYQIPCPFGLVNFALPINIGADQRMNLIIGPVNFENSIDVSVVINSLQKLGIKDKRTQECFDKLPKISSSQLQYIVNFLQTVIQLMKRLNIFRQDSETKVFTLEKESINSFLKIFLELSMKLCDAEFGSVMVFEKSTQQLSIKESKGLSKEVVNETKIKPGEGLAGLTIERRKALFLNDQLKDREARLRMNKPTIKSAFVIPVFYHKDILGVISVATAKQPNRFSDQLMELLNELVGLALERVSIK